MSVPPSVSRQRCGPLLAAQHPALRQIHSCRCCCARAGEGRCLLSLGADGWQQVWSLAAALHFASARETLNHFQCLWIWVRLPGDSRGLHLQLGLVADVDSPSLCRSHRLRAGPNSLTPWLTGASLAARHKREGAAGWVSVPVVGSRSGRLRPHPILPQQEGTREG